MKRLASSTTSLKWCQQSTKSPGVSLIIATAPCLGASAAALTAASSQRLTHLPCLLWDFGCAGVFHKRWPFNLPPQAKLRGLRCAGSAIVANQYSVTEYFKQVHQHETQMPAIYFKYEMSPIRVELDASNGQSFLQLLVKLAACIGGVFACTSFAAGVLPLK